MLLYLGMEKEILVVDPDHPQEAVAILRETQITSLTIDPRVPDRIFCGTHGEGLLRSVDAGNTWTRVGQGIIESTNVLSVATSPAASPDVVFAGTEPSALYRSDDGGDTWLPLPGLQDVPSKPHWSFPPKPDTHHVRWIAPHPTDKHHLFVAIEAGALLQSRDGGESWQDRVPGGPIDTHTLVIHGSRPDRLVSAAGDGCFVSDDRGATWRKTEAGLPWRYCYGLAVDASDPDRMVMSVAPGPRQGHGGRGRAMAAIVRADGDTGWQVCSDGLPNEDGTTLSVLAAHPHQSGVFFALNNRGLYQTDDGATSWRRIDVPWKDEYLDRRPPAIAVGMTG